MKLKQKRERNLNLKDNNLQVKKNLNKNTQKWNKKKMFQKNVSYKYVKLIL